MACGKSCWKIYHGRRFDTSFGCAFFLFMHCHFGTVVTEKGGKRLTMFKLAAKFGNELKDKCDISVGLYGWDEDVEEEEMLV